jgi:hypothetical protein
LLVKFKLTHYLAEDLMPASLRQLPENHKLDYDHEHTIECSHCGQKYLLVWDDKEWNYVKDWIRVATFAVRKSHPLYGEVAGLLVQDNSEKGLVDFDFAVVLNEA